MSYRCNNAFAFDGLMYSAGCEIQDGDPILKTHADHFDKVDAVGATATERASAAPGEKRSRGGGPEKVGGDENKSPGAKRAPAKRAAASTSPESNDDSEGKN